MIDEIIGKLDSAYTRRVLEEMIKINSVVGREGELAFYLKKCHIATRFLSQNGLSGWGVGVLPWKRPQPPTTLRIPDLINPPKLLAKFLRS